MVSKALIVGAYQGKLEEIARHPDVELACVVPPSWRQDGREQQLERAHTEGYELIVEPIRWNGNFHLFYFPGLGRRLSRLRPDILHIDEEPYNLATFLATRLALRQGARPLFFTWQNIYRRYPPPFRWLENYVLRKAPQSIAGSGEAADVIRRKGYRGRVAVIPQFGVDPIRFEPRRNGPDPSGTFTIGYLGRFVEEKGLFVLLDALDGLAGDWRLELFGHGQLQRQLQDRATSLGITGRVLFHPPVPSDDVPGVLHRLSTVVLPSLTRPNWKEQFGRVLVEAMACGLPVIGSDSGEIRQVVGDAGLLFPEGDAAALRFRLTELMASKHRLAELVARGRQRVLDRFTHERIAEATCVVYRRMLAQSPERD